MEAKKRSEAFLDGLKAQMEYAGRMRDFRDSIAPCELERLEIVAKGYSTRGKPQLVLWLAPSVA